MSKKTLTITILSVILVAVISVSAALAFLVDKTESKVNRFKYMATDEALNAKLTEDEWDGVTDYEYDEDGNITEIKRTDIDDEDLGENIAKELVPDMDIPKNPVITNLSTKLDEWAAIKISFRYGEEAGDDAGKLIIDPDDLNAVLTTISIDFATDDTVDGYWVLIDGTDTSAERTFLYSKLLTKKDDSGNVTEDGATNALFTTVTIKAEATKAQMEAVREIGGFAIYVEGAVYQDTMFVDFAAFQTGYDASVFPTLTQVDLTPTTKSRYE